MFFLDKRGWCTADQPYKNDLQQNVEDNLDV